MAARKNWFAVAFIPIALIN